MTTARPVSTDEPHGHTRPAPHHAVPYLYVFYALVALTAVTLAAAFKRFDDEWVNVSLALLVAWVKATLVGRFFMHLKFEGKLIYLILGVPLLLGVILVLALIPDIGHGFTHRLLRPPFTPMVEISPAR